MGASARILLEQKKAHSAAHSAGLSLAEEIEAVKREKELICGAWGILCRLQRSRKRAQLALPMLNALRGP